MVLMNKLLEDHEKNVDGFRFGNDFRHNTKGMLPKRKN